LAAGRTPFIDNEAGGAQGTSVIAPGVLFEELDVYAIEAEPERAPITPPPHARSR
jgi:hypothetical protein